MARNPRKNLEGNYFHVMVQGIGKEHIFPNDDCKGYYISCLRRAQEKYPAKVLGFCVMGNHSHVLVSVQNTVELSCYFKQVNTLYANYYNRVNSRVGYVFRNRFRSELIVNQRYLVYCLAYIQNNPLKAGIVDKAEDYGWSSYTNYLNRAGLVDFKEAQKYYDTGAENIRAIMQERTDLAWMDHEENRSKVDPEKVLIELKKRFGIQNEEKITDIKIALAITLQMQQRCGTSVKEMARLLGVGRETLRKMVVVNTVP